MMLSVNFELKQKHNMLCFCVEVMMKLTNVSEEYVIYGTLFSLSNRIQTMGDGEFRDITLKQQFVLIALEMFDSPPSLNEMGALIGCSYQNVKRMAQHLKDAGYLEIKQDQKDKRKFLLIPTDKIEKEAEQNRAKTTAFMERLYKNIS
ncbi:MAG: MarR family winged helix-turn-helix transcriptional regulator [Lachnospiraceae bacterium]|nr:MarR family winged helix-turn-helix transcriptional regulator [Lachnospiraceae bacterium]